MESPLSVIKVQVLCMKEETKRSTVHETHEKIQSIRRDQALTRMNALVSRETTQKERMERQRPNKLIVPMVCILIRYKMKQPERWNMKHVFKNKSS